MHVTLSEISICPTKGMKGVSLDSATLTPHGIQGDRITAVASYDEKRGWQCLGRSKLPQFAIFESTISSDLNHLKLLSPSGASFTLELNRLPKSAAEVVIHSYQHSSLAIDLGDQVAAWLQSELQSSEEVRFFLHCAHNKIERPDKFKGTTPPKSFADRNGITYGNQASYDDLNDYLSEAQLPLADREQFGLNLVTSGAAAWSEHEINDVLGEGFSMLLIAPLDRCPYVNVKGGENLRKQGPLAALREVNPLRGGGNSQSVFFGEIAELNELSGPESVSIRIGQRWELR